MRIRLGLMLGLLILPGSAWAQIPCTSPTPQTTPPTFTCQSGSPRTAIWDYSGLIAGDVFRFFVNGAQVGPDIPATNGTVQVQFGGTLPVGTYAVVVQTVRGTLVAPSYPVNLVLTVPSPPAPSNFHIVETTLRGLDLAGNLLWEREVLLMLE